MSIFTGIDCLAQNNNLPKEIKVGKERVKIRKEMRLPEFDGYLLLKCDFHIHTIFSDGIVWPTLRIEEAWEEGLDAIALTEHIEGQPARTGVMKGNHNYAYEQATTEAQKRNIILIRGAEITRAMPPGHLNALFLKDANPLDQKDFLKAIEEAHNQGAFIFWNHPGWGVDEIKWYDIHEEIYKKGWLNGIEVYNEFEWYPQALNWCNERNLTLIGNTDVHDVTERLYDFSRMSYRPMTIVLSKDRTEDGIKEALFDRRTILYFYNTLMGKEDILKKLFFTSIEISEPHFVSGENNYATIKNNTDIPFLLTAVNKDSKGFPQKIEIPAGGSIIISYPEKASESIEYEVENMIVTPEKKVRLKFPLIPH